MMNKYRSKKVVVDGISFDSKREADRWRELSRLERGGEITNLKRQVRFPLLPAQRELTGEIGKDGRFQKGKVVEREVDYIADFTYLNKNGFFVVEDTKGVRTRDYILKRKMMLFFHGIRVIEV